MGGTWSTSLEGKSILLLLYLSGQLHDTDPPVLFSCISMMTNMAQDKFIRRAMSTSTKFVKCDHPIGGKF